ncbi:MAG TPA: SDR family oxidoreductase [Dehalococcoidia bacterium]|nr:SDR family oxidoreductase [Dehalococcoidia bacterium]
MSHGARRPAAVVGQGAVMEIEGKVALVTGAVSGIGRATAVALASAGAKFAVVDVDADGGGETVRQVEQAGSEATFLAVGLTDAAQVQSMVAETEARFGGLDIVHNNAGILTATRDLAQADLDRWLAMVQINSTAVLLGTRAAIPALQRRGGGVIVQTASGAGLMPYPSSPVYAATKSGVVGFTRSLVHLKEELNIRVSCVCPDGWIRRWSRLRRTCGRPRRGHRA